MNWNQIPRIPQRDGYGQGLLDLCAARPDVVVLDADVAASTRTNWVRDRFPDHFYNLGISEQDLVGTAAGLEIPAMILAGYYVKRFGKRKMMVAAVAAGVLFYLGLILFHGRTALLALQLFNAIFIGIIAGIGMLWFQDLMPGRAGAATTLFTNSISTGVILAGVMQGALSQSYGHASVYWTIAAISLVTLFLTSRVKDI